MKTRNKTSVIAAAIIALAALALAACKGDEPAGGTKEQPKVQREFTDLTLVREKSITLIDETGGTTDLKAQGIWQKFNEAFGKVALNTAGSTKFDAIYANGGKITITVVAIGPDDETIGHNIKLSLSFVNTTDDLAGWISTLINYDVTE